jgi:3-isopropylmalate dehydrogenase
MGRSLKLAVMPGDGIGTEVTAVSLAVLKRAGELHGFTIAAEEYDLGSRRYNATGELLPASVLEEIRGSDAILFGAIGDPSVPPGVLERGILLRMRFELDLFLNLRPVRLYPGVRGPLADKGPDDIDLVVCREGTEGPYAGIGGIVGAGSQRAIANEVAVHTWVGVERIVRDAFQRARARRGRLTLVAKSNVLVHSGRLWQEVFETVAVDFEDVETEYLHVDAASMFFVTHPERFDVVVTDNLFGDIITDIGAAIAGGLGFAASGNIDPTRRCPSLFEPVHGSAPDIAGQGLADPTAAVLSAALLLDHVGERQAAQTVESAAAAAVVARAGRQATTAQVCDGILAALG